MEADNNSLLLIRDSVFVKYLRRLRKQLR